MLVIPCPWCGERHESEFLCGGPAHAPRPQDPGALSDEEWVDYLTVAPNPTGFLEEKWCHVLGCGLWFSLARHTVTHEIRPVAESDPKRETP